MIRSARNQFIGFHATREVKDALKKEARKQQASISLLAFHAVVQKLREAGHDVSDVVEGTDADDLATGGIEGTDTGLALRETR
jgi:hypothetical protein